MKMNIEDEGVMVIRLENSNIEVEIHPPQAGQPAETLTVSIAGDMGDSYDFSAEGWRLYADGHIVGARSAFAIQNEDLKGRLALANVENRQLKGWLKELGSLVQRIRF